MDVTKLNDADLNLAMIWISGENIRLEIHGGESWYFCSTSDQLLEYLTDWSLTGPLMVKYDIDISSDIYTEDGTGIEAREYQAESDTKWALNQNPLRAICECRLMIYIESK